ncbi:uncharacterized protein L969DRAFT_44413 [Mixia osmundae IAM 14324]|uniref:Transcription initiation factor IIA subunit 2 n=1 Tax=Mixia osmundae (strain CBS 9802 / IAM 14324 / JCM 22182 / KY 12970) TaxID=764103 RepID=G7E874_MIXOS|nr:uncharacterized protein L969DRAFT_44413 [Mixia osmundae IAM 14324]KEI42374.1 hypothetical protein L969DRAFT_44413 [Mixia osmundae IAM 14324]GAA99034.1 hypothetical protein E5Q_05723 [Mixia osmundae IAM 14324]
MSQPDVKTPTEALRESAFVNPEASEGKNWASRHARRGYTDYVSKSFPSAPHAVGTLELELPCDQQTFASDSVTLPDGSPALKLDTILMTLYYPARLERGRSYERLPWMNRPLSATAGGYADYASLTGYKRALAIPILMTAAALIRVPAFVNAPLAEPASAAKHPLVVFSHGMAGSRQMYSQYCGTLAARGFVVAALEHRDGSGPASAVNGKAPRIVRYLKYDDMPRSTRPAELMGLRHAQLAMRTAELVAAVDALRRFGRDPQKSIQDNLRVSGATGFTSGRASGEVADIDTQAWQRVDYDNVHLSSHSFGGTTVLAALADSTFAARGIRSATLLDPWLEPLSKTTRPDSRIPLLAINSPNFTLWRGHFDELVKIFRPAVRDHPSSALVTVQGITHTTFSDVAWLAPGRKSGSTGKRSSADPTAVMGLFVDNTAAFIAGEGHRSNPKAALDYENIKAELKKLQPGQSVSHFVQANFRMASQQNFYELYRRSSLGLSLTDALDELIQSGHINPQLALKVLAKFDKAAALVLASSLKTKCTVKGHLKTYRLCDEVWTFILTDATLKLEGSEVMGPVGKVKIVACKGA